MLCEEAFKCINKAACELMRLNSYDVDSVFCKDDLVPIIPTATGITISVSIEPTASEIVPTCATITPKVILPLSTTSNSRCPMCLGCGKFFDTLEDLEIHRQHRYNCTIHIADKKLMQYNES